MLVSDGGGKRVAALRIFCGRKDIALYFKCISWRYEARSATVKVVQAVRINGHPGVVVQLDDGLQTLALQPTGNGRIGAIYLVRNPEKLGHVATV